MLNNSLLKTKFFYRNKLSNGQIWRVIAQSYSSDFNFDYTDYPSIIKSYNKVAFYSFPTEIKVFFQYLLRSAKIKTNQNSIFICEWSAVFFTTSLEIYTIVVIYVENCNFTLTFHKSADNLFLMNINLTRRCTRIQASSQKFIVNQTLQ